MESRTFLATLAVTVTAALLFSIDLFLPLGVAAGTPYVAIVLLAAWMPWPRMPLHMAAFCSLLTVAGGFWSPEGGVLWMGITNRALGVAILWITAVLVFRRRRTEERLHRANQDLDVFVRTVSHDLRSPLSPILGYAEILREEYGHCLREEGTAALDEIEAQGRRMLALIDDLLHMATVGCLERPSAPVDADRVLKRVVEGWREKADEAGCELLCSKLPGVAVPETLLAQVFDNLLGNAVRYAGGGGQIEIGGERLADRVRYYVRDHGPGIAADERERVFEAFWRGASTGSVSGTGIGLATVRKIAVQFGGRVWVEAAPGGGSIFWVELPEPRR